MNYSRRNHLAIAVILGLSALGTAQEDSLPTPTPLARAIQLEDIQHAPMEAVDAYRRLMKNSELTESARRHAALRLAGLLQSLGQTGEECDEAYEFAASVDDPVGLAARAARSQGAQDGVRDRVAQLLQKGTRPANWLEQLVALGQPAVSHLTELTSRELDGRWRYNEVVQGEALLQRVVHASGTTAIWQIGGPIARQHFESILESTAADELTHIAISLPMDGLLIADDLRDLVRELVTADEDSGIATAAALSVLTRRPQLAQPEPVIAYELLKNRNVLRGSPLFEIRTAAFQYLRAMRSPSGGFANAIAKAIETRQDLEFFAPELQLGHLKTRKLRARLLEFLPDDLPPQSVSASQPVDVIEAINLEESRSLASKIAGEPPQPQLVTNQRFFLNWVVMAGPQAEPVVVELLRSGLVGQSEKEDPLTAAVRRWIANVCPQESLIDAFTAVRDSYAQSTNGLFAFGEVLDSLLDNREELPDDIFAIAEPLLGAAAYPNGPRAHRDGPTIAFRARRGMPGFTESDRTIGKLITACPHERAIPWIERLLESQRNRVPELEIALHSLCRTFPGHADLNRVLLSTWSKTRSPIALMILARQDVILDWPANTSFEGGQPPAVERSNRRPANEFFFGCKEFIDADESTGFQNPYLQILLGRDPEGGAWVRWSPAAWTRFLSGVYADAAYSFGAPGTPWLLGDQHITDLRAAFDGVVPKEVEDAIQAALLQSFDWDVDDRAAHRLDCLRRRPHPFGATDPLTKRLRAGVVNHLLATTPSHPERRGARSLGEIWTSPRRQVLATIMRQPVEDLPTNQPDVTARTAALRLACEDPAIPQIEPGHLANHLRHAGLTISIDQWRKLFVTERASFGGPHDALLSVLEPKDAELEATRILLERSGGSETKIRLANRIAASGDPAGATLLIPLLSNDSESVRNAAEKALRQMRLARSEARFWRDVQDGAALDSPEDAAAKLLRTLQTTDNREIRLLAIRSLGALKRPEVLPVLIERLEVAEGGLELQALRDAIESILADLSGG